MKKSEEVFSQYLTGKGERAGSFSDGRKIKMSSPAMWEGHSSVGQMLCLEYQCQTSNDVNNYRCAKRNENPAYGRNGEQQAQGCHGWYNNRY